MATGIVQEAVEANCSHIAFEDPTDIRERMPGAKRLHTWAFRRLDEYVSYKAEKRGIVAEPVNPASTCQRCSHTACAFSDSANRPTRNRFQCQQCGYELRPDDSAAKNIGF